MMAENARELMLILEGAAFGALSVFALAGVAAYLDNVKRGIHLEGEGLERMRKRGELP